MRGGRNNRYTVFDVMDAKGVFEQNPANASSPMYTGPVEYPKMFYHPKGRMRVIQQAEVIQTPYGPEKVGELKELIYRTVNDREEEARIRAAGWHDNPSDSVEAGGGTVSSRVDRSEVADLERQFKEIQARLDAARTVSPSVDEFGEEIEEEEEGKKEEAIQVGGRSSLGSDV